MTDNHYPTVDFDFFFQLICHCDKIQEQMQVGNIIVIITKGSSATHRRLIYLKKSRGNVVTYFQATGIAIRLGCMGELLKWYEDNRGFKDGGYTTESNK